MLIFLPVLPILLVWPRLTPSSQIPRVLLRLHRYPAGAPLPGQGEVRHIHCLIGITSLQKAAGTVTAVQGQGHGRDSSDTYSKDGTVTRMAGTAVRQNQVPQGAPGWHQG